MNPLVLELADGSMPAKHEKESSPITVEDHIGQSIQIYFQNIRLDFSVDEFEQIATNFENACQHLNEYAE